jgi:hypothetical protein
LVITSSKSLNSTTVLNVNSIVYFNRKNKIISAAPFVGSSVSHFTVPLKVKLSMENRLNHKMFKFYCINSSNGQILSNAEITNSSSWNTTFSCDVKSNRNVGSFPLSVSFVYNSTNYEIATNASIIFVDRIILDNFYGFKSGMTPFTFDYPTNSFPTLYKSDYSIKLMYNDFNEFKSVQCAIKNGYIFGSCISPSIDSKIFPRNVQFSIFVDGEFSITLNPWFRYLETPLISKILPSSSIDIFTSEKTIKLQSSSFFPNSQNKKYKIQFVELGNAIQECNTESSYQISCIVPKNNQLTGNQITMKISIDGENYEVLNKKLYLYTNDVNSDKSVSIFASSLSPNIVSSSNRTNITMQINIPISITLPSNLMFVRFKDQIIEEVSTGIIQNGKIICQVPHFGNYNVYYPRMLTIDASFDGNSYFGSTQSIQVNGFQMVNILPTLFIVGSDMKILISNFPSLNLKPNEKIIFKMISKTLIVEFNCTINLTLCESSNKPPVDVYNVQLYINDGIQENRFFIPLSVEKISVNSKPILELQNIKILREMKKVMYLNGNGFSLMKNSIKIRGFFDGKLIDASVTVEENRIGFIFPQIKRSTKRSSFNNQLQISYNGINFEIVSSNIQLIDSFTFDKIITTGGLSSVTFSFQNTTLNLIGTNLNQSSAIIKLENELFSFSTAAKSQDFNNIQVDIPQFSYYSPNIPFNFPVTVTIGVSLNGGVDFQNNAIIISDKFSSFFLVGILPNLGDRKSRNITMRGANLKDVFYCIFKDSNRSYTQVVNVIKESEDLICPFEYQSKYNSVKSIFISLKNAFNDTSDEYPFNFVGLIFYFSYK